MHGITPYVSFNVMFKFSLHFTSKCKTIDHFWVPKNPHFQIETKCTTFLVTMSFIYMRMKNHFHIKGWAFNLVLIQRPRGTQKWPSWKENLVVLQKSFKAFPPTLTLLAIFSEGTDWCLAAKKGVARREGIKRSLPSWEGVGGESFFSWNMLLPQCRIYTLILI